MTDRQMMIIVGLGNPGPKYAFNRHNIGFMVIDALAERADGLTFKTEKKSWTAKLHLGSRQALLVKPQTFMNRSGEAVQSLIHFYNVHPQDHLLVIQDDIDLPFGALKFQKNRGHGGHNGIRDIHAQLGNPDYHRLKLGVGRPVLAGQGVAGHVLQNFAPEDMDALTDFLVYCCEAVECYIEKGFEKAATHFNRKAI